jgi:hypothetical protein
VSPNFKSSAHAAAAQKLGRRKCVYAVVIHTKYYSKYNRLDRCFIQVLRFCCFEYSNQSNRRKTGIANDNHYALSMGRAKGGIQAVAALQDVSGSFDAVLGTKRGMSQSLRSIQVDADTMPATLKPALLKYKPGQVVSGVSLFDETTDQFKPVKKKIGDGVLFNTLSGSHVRQMKPASRPPGPHNPTAMRKKDLERLYSEIPDEIKEFAESLSEKQAFKMYCLSHEGDGISPRGDNEQPTLHSFIFTDEDNYFIKAFTEDNEDSRKVVDTYAPYIARLP